MATLESRGSRDVVQALDLVTLNQFVFVVCGGRQHIEELNYSLRALRRHTKNCITVVTELRRNEVPIDHHNVIEATTPASFSHHQASIYLKTSLHRILPAGPCYCYLDTDVIALSPQVDAIFAERKGAVNFAADHCNLSRFSPYAVKCGCLAQNESELEIIRSLERGLTTPEDIAAESQSREGPVRRLLRQLRPPSPKNWSFDTRANLWRTPDGRNVYDLQCKHLAKAIQSKFDIRVKNQAWQHWNGGVFLFDAQGHSFLEAWHRKTLMILQDPYWSTRDQGTLVATAWEMGLEKARLLPDVFNYIADYDKGTVCVVDDALQSKIGEKLYYCNPAFIHIYHHFGDEKWAVWSWVDAMCKMDGERPK